MTAWIAVQTADVAPAPAADPTAMVQDETLAGLRAADQRLVERIRQELDKPEASPHDVRLRARALGFDPARIFAFVQQEIRFEPYAGLQRGAAGVLVSGAGNSADKACLLAELLRQSGRTSRMVAGKLDRDAARALLESALQSLRARPGRRVVGPFGTGADDPKRRQEICRAVGVSPDEFEKLAAGSWRLQQDNWHEVLEVAASEQQYLKAMAEAAKLWPEPAPVQDGLLDSIQNHYWVQWRAADQDAWLEVDPCSSDPSGRIKLCSAPGQVVDPAKIADRLTVSLELRRRNPDGKEEEVPLFEHEVPVFETLLRPLRFRIDPADSKHPMPRQEEHLGLDDSIARFKAMSQFQGVLMVGSEAFGSRAFDYEGNAFAIQNNGGLGLLGGATGLAANKASDLFGGAAGKRTLTSLWVGFRVQRENELVWSQRRVILEEAKRADWCPVLSWDLLLQAQPFSSSFARAMALQSRVRSDATMTRFVDWVASAGKSSSLESVMASSPTHYPQDLLDFCVARQAWLDARADPGAPRLLYFDRPNLLISGQQVRFRPDSKKLCLCYGIDLVENGALVLAATEHGFTLDRQATFGLGVFDTALELAQVRSANEPEAQSGTIPWFERARALALPIQFVPAGDGNGLQAAGVPAADATWIQSNSPNGGQVLVAKGAPGGCCSAFAWWAYEPATGRMVGRITGGMGGSEVELALPCTSMVEHVFLVVNIGLCAFNVYRSLADGHYGAAAGEAAICLFLSGAASNAAKGTKAAYQGAKVAREGSLGAAMVIELVDLMLNINGLKSDGHD